jgi:hypothetical protein
MGRPLLDGARDSVVPVGWQGAVGSTYWTSQGNVRRGIAVWWKTGLDVVPLPDNCFTFIFGFKIRGPGKGNDLVGAVVYLSFLGEEKTKEVLQWAKKWAKQGPAMILGDFNTGAVLLIHNHQVWEGGASVPFCSSVVSVRPKPSHYFAGSHLLAEL